MDGTKIIIAIGVFLLFLITPVGIVVTNTWEYANQKVDDRTSYETRKKVEDSCRSLIVSYQNDRLIYEQFKDSEKPEEVTWANNAKMRANKAAVTYNEYFLKNSFVFQGNIPDDICNELEIIG